MKAADIFSQWFNAEKDEVKRVRQGEMNFESGRARESFSRLSLADKTLLGIFCKAWNARPNSQFGRPDITRNLGWEMIAHIGGHDAAELVANPDFLVCLKVFLGDVADEV